MNYRQVTPTFLNVARQYQQDMTEASNYYKSQNFDARMHRNGLDVDARDFIPMVALMGIEGRTPDERAADIRAKMEKLAKAFEDPDHKKRDDYLDLIYYLVDDFGSTFDPAAMNMNDPKQVEQLLQSMLIDQTVSTKMLENPEYIRNRYPTPAARNLMDACEHFRMAIGSTVKTNLNKIGIDIDIILSLPQGVPEDSLDIHHCREMYEKNLLDAAIETKGNLPESQTIDFPILDDLIPFFSKDLGDIPNISTHTKGRMADYYNLLIAPSQLQQGSKNMQGLKEADIQEPTKVLYVDGKPFMEFVEENFRNVEKSGVLYASVIGTCMFSGRHKLDIVHAYRDEAGQMQYEAKTMRASVTPEQEELYMQQFSWIHRTFFNWGPFRIEPLQEKLDRIGNDPNTKARHDTVIADQKAKIEAGIARKEENARRFAQKLQQDKARREACREVTDRLGKSVVQWDKNSVIGILGRQISGTFRINKTEVTGAIEAIRKELAATFAQKSYGKIAPLFARVVLYDQLCSDRTANGGQPGEIEKMMGLGGYKTAVESINNTAVRMAGDPVFKELFLEKAGSMLNDERCPDVAKFERMIVGGGIERFRAEYMQKLQKLASQKEQQAPVNELEKENQKQQDAPAKQYAYTMQNT